MTPTAKLLCELIALPSVNPAFLPAGDARAGEKRIAEFLATTAAKGGLHVELQKVASGRSNLLARLSPSDKVRKRLLLAAHLDTVAGDSKQIFRPRRNGDRLYGRGACDTKGSVAAMFTALCEVARSSHHPKETEFLFAGLVDEEYAQAGSRALASSKLTADLAIVGEPTRCRVVTAHKGSLWLRLETCGREAHGATPERGINAVHAMACIVDSLQTDYAKDLGRRRHPLLGHPTLSVGVIAGGVQPNIVPDLCMIEIDRRTLPGETETGVRRELAAFLRRRRLHVNMASTKLAPCPALETDPRLPQVQRFMRCVGQARPVGAHFFCDASVLAAGGIPSVVFGPGDIAQAHRQDEWISLKSLERAKDLLVKFLQSLP
jgi:acetylornithine deacetylase/succinyl-diaminopimelate desuccinylase-like protein